MPQHKYKRSRHRNRTMRGGFLDSLTNTFSGWGSSISQGASNLWGQTKKATSSLTGSNPSYTSSSYTPSYTPPPTSTTVSTPSSPSSMGGKRRRMRGGFKDNTPNTGIAVHAAPFSGKTAQPQTMVGGKTKRHKKRSRKTRRR